MFAKHNPFNQTPIGFGDSGVARRQIADHFHLRPESGKRRGETHHHIVEKAPKLSMLILKKQRNSTDSPVNGLVSHSEWIRGHEDRRTYCGWRNAESEAYQRALCRPIGRCQARAGELVAAPIRKKRSRPGGGI